MWLLPLRRQAHVLHWPGGDNVSDRGMTVSDGEIEEGAEEGLWNVFFISILGFTAV
jgi:hypothetical protein